MTHTELILAEVAALTRGDHKEAKRLQAIRWSQAMGIVVNTENTGKRRQQGYGNAEQVSEMHLIVVREP